MSRLFTYFRCSSRRFQCNWPPPAALARSAWKSRSGPLRNIWSRKRRWKNSRTSLRISPAAPWTRQTPTGPLRFSACCYPVECTLPFYPLFLSLKAFYCYYYYYCGEELAQKCAPLVLCTYVCVLRADDWNELGWMELQSLAFSTCPTWWIIPPTNACTLHSLSTVP